MGCYLPEYSVWDMSVQQSLVHVAIAKWSLYICGYNLIRVGFKKVLYTTIQEYIDFFFIIIIFRKDASKLSNVTVKTFTFLQKIPVSHKFCLFTYLLNILFINSEKNNHGFQHNNKKCWQYIKTVKKLFQT